MSTFSRTTLCKIGHFFVRLSVVSVAMSFILCNIVNADLPDKEPDGVETTIFNPHPAQASDEDKKDENSIFNMGGSTEIEHRQDGSIYIYLGDRINANTVTTEVLKAVTDAPKGTDVVIVASGFGGSVHYGVKLLNAINNAEANIIYRVIGNVHSMHSDFICSNAKIELMGMGYVMFHNTGANGVSGKLQEIRAGLVAIENLTNKIFKGCVKKGILTIYEVITIKNGNDIYLDFDEARKRLRKQ